MGKIVLLSGIPASGKSTHGKWLETEMGCVYWDLEHETLEEAGTRAGLYLGTNADLGSLLAVAKRISKTIVIDWGFPPDVCLNTVRWLSENGVEIWWFDGDREAARISFLRRSPELEQALDIQMEKIVRFDTEIKDLFEDHQINSVTLGPKYLSHKKIYKTLFPEN